MGIHDRDYMRRRREEDDDRYPGESTENKASGMLGRFFDKYPRFGFWLAAVLAVLILGALVWARLSIR
jgi:hypothetical protein